MFMRSNQLFYAVIAFVYLTVLVLLHIANFLPPFATNAPEQSQVIQTPINPIHAASYDSARFVTPESLDNINAQTFQTKVINPVLFKLNIYSPSTSTLLLGTAIQESLVGKLSKNVFQITLRTAKNINAHYLTQHPELQNAVNNYYVPDHTLQWNLKNNVNYQTALASVVYLSSNKPIPNADNPETLGKFWKVNYNSYLGKGTAREYATHLQYVLSNDQVPVSELNA